MQTLGILDIRQGKGCFIKDFRLGPVAEELRTFLKSKGMDILYLMEARKVLEREVA